MGINIKNPVVVEKIRALAELENVGLTEAIDKAVSRALDEQEAKKIQFRMAMDEIRSMAKEASAHREGMGSDHSFLYGDDGLPT